MPAHVLAFGRRFFVFSLAGFCVLGATSAALYEAAHQYVEHVQLAPDLDPDTRKWEWHRSAEYWADPLRRGGGTDPALGFKGRHILRAAWMAENWGMGHHSTALINPSQSRLAEGLPGPAGIRVVDAALQRSDDFLRNAIRIAEERAGPATLNALLLRHASVLERLGGSFRAASKTEYERAWAISPEAHVAWKLGELNSRLGHADNALAWWTRSILLASGKNADGDERHAPVVPSSVPPSPYAQRTLANTLVSLSAFYATSGQLTNAQQVEESALSLIRSIPSSESLSSPAQLLHTLYLLHRYSLLSIHLAEVLRAQKQPSLISIQWLTSAAESSERVAYALAGLPIDGRASVPQAQGRELINTYKSSHTMNKIASNLLRDASRTAAEAWHLIGILHESAEIPSSSEKALECYERAVEWAGKTMPQSDAKVAADGTLEADWKTIWSNYHRLKQCGSQDK